MLFKRKENRIREDIKEVNLIIKEAEQTRQQFIKEMERLNQILKEVSK